jgi:hypothetical protein
MIYKLESLEETSKEANVKVLDVLAWVSYFIQENLIYNKKPE